MFLFSTCIHARELLRVTVCINLQYLSISLSLSLLIICPVVFHFLLLFNICLRQWRRYFQHYGDGKLTFPNFMFSPHFRQPARPSLVEFSSHKTGQAFMTLIRDQLTSIWFLSIDGRFPNVVFSCGDFSPGSITMQFAIYLMETEEHGRSHYIHNFTLSIASYKDSASFTWLTLASCASTLQI